MFLNTPENEAPRICFSGGKYAWSWVASFFPPAALEHCTLVSLEKIPHNIKTYCHTAHLERQDSNLRAGSNFKDKFGSGQVFGIHIWKKRTLKTHFPSTFWSAQTDGSIYFFFLFGLDFRGGERRLKHFKLSSSSFSKNTLLVLGAFTLLSVQPFVIHRGSSSAMMFSSASLQTINLWTWLNYTGAQHRKPETGVNTTLPDWMTTPRVRVSCLSPSSWHRLPSLQETLTLQKRMLRLLNI